MSIMHAVWQTVTGQEPTVMRTRRRRNRMKQKTKGWRLSNAKSCPDTTPTRSFTSSILSVTPKVTDERLTLNSVYS